MFDLDFLKTARGRIDDFAEQSELIKTWDNQIQECTLYCMKGAGKAVRPALVFWSFENSRGNVESRIRDPHFQSLCLHAGFALELIHTYSLVHDDLPSMDNDDFRRGKPTLHKAKSEALAILAGDGFLTGAFEFLVTGPFEKESELSTAAVRILARAAGASGMVAGQVRDMEKRGTSLAELLEIHRLKTGMLFGAALEMGALLAGVSGAGKELLFQTWGEDLGIVFQLRDDYLDRFSNFENLGKSVGKDLQQQKLTAFDFFSKENLESEILRRVGVLKDKAMPLFTNPHGVQSVLDFFVNRNS